MSSEKYYNQTSSNWYEHDEEHLNNTKRKASNDFQLMKILTITILEAHEIQRPTLLFIQASNRFLTRPKAIKSKSFI